MDVGIVGHMLRAVTKAAHEYTCFQFLPVPVPSLVWNMRVTNTLWCDEKLIFAHFLRPYF